MEKSSSKPWLWVCMWFFGGVPWLIFHTNQFPSQQNKWRRAITFQVKVYKHPKINIACDSLSIMVVERLLSSWEKPIFRGYVSFRAHIPVDVNQQKMHEKISILLSSASVEKSHISGICFNRTLGKHGNWEVEKMLGCAGQESDLLLGFHAFKWEGSMKHVASWSYIQLPNPNKSIDSRESGERRNQSPSLGCPPSQAIVTTRNFTFLHKDLNLHLPLLLGRETSQSQEVHHPIPLPPTLRATEVLDWLFICAAAGAIGGQRCLIFMQLQKQQPPPTINRLSKKNK